TCCDIIDKSKCPNGETMIASDGCEICKCESPTSCPSGQKLVKNYVDGVACGEVCCEVKGSEFSTDGCDVFNSDYDYKVVGAIEGICCGGYSYGTYWLCNGGCQKDNCQSTVLEQNYYILINGEAYCANEETSKFSYEGELFQTDTTYYENSSKFCSKCERTDENWEGCDGETHCKCSDGGNPRYGADC
ncbi:MAG: hypothetical protein IJC30_03235, partial [Alphaproteobacteria bacterium]|nr:hypothetical protein [Alphaproteobacteria bacterium]